MNTNEGSIQIRRGLIEHIEKGKLPPSALGVYVMLHLIADCTSGVWIGSAVKLRLLYFSTTDLRTIQRIVKHLENIRFIRCFRIQGRKGNYAFLVNNYPVSKGTFLGKRLNAWESPDAESLVYKDGTT
jgi:hypothetical protein